MRTSILILIMLGVSLSAQAWQGQGRGPEGPGPGMQRENMEAVRIWKMTEMLVLTEEQIATFIPAVQIHERKVQGLQKQMGEEMRKLQMSIKEGNIKQKDADKALETFIILQQEVHQTKIDFLQKLPEYLTPEQQLRYLSFEVEFRKHLRQFIQDRRGQPPGRPGK